MQKNRVITKKDLQSIARLAHNYFMDLANKDLDNAEFIAKCYLEACSGILGIKNYEYEEKIPYIPADDE